MKRCGQCGRQFPDNYRYCDQDATPLAAAKGIPNRSWILVGAASAALVCALAIAGPPQLGRYLKSHIEVEAVGVGLDADSWPGANIKLSLLIHNTAPFGPVLHSLKLGCAVAGANAVTLEWPSGFEPGLAINGNSDTPVQLKVSPRHIDPESIEQVLRGRATVSCAGPAEFSFLGARFAQRMEFTKTLR